MTHISAWISPSLTHAIAWSLLHFLWQGLALAGICAVIMSACRSASARYIVALSTLALMLAAPIVTVFVLQRSAAANFAGSAANPIAISSTAILSSAPNFVAASSNASSLPVPIHSDALLWLVEIWFAGVVFFSLRTAGGLIVVQRMRRHQTRPVAVALLDKCRALQRRMQLNRAIRYCECLVLEAPAVIGWFRPIVLLPVTALSGLSEDQLAAVISHELAHIRRLDSFVNLFQIAAETLLFYHPAAWWLNKRIRAERENCCDDAALAICGNPVEYARALTLMEEWRQRPALAMAANRSPLVARVARLLGIASPRSGIRTAGIAAGILCFAGALFAGNALMAAGRISSPELNGFLNASAQPAAAANAKTFAAPRVSTAASSQITTGSAPEPAPRSSQSQSAQSKTSASSTASTSHIDRMKAQGYDNLTADELISLKVQGVIPEYIQQIKALGLHPTVSELISMRVQGIDPQYIKDMRDAGFNTDINQLISMRVQGITPEYIRKMRAAGVNGDANEFISMKVQCLTPGYISQMKAAGVTADTNQLISMKVQGLTPEYAKEMKAVGVNADTNQLIGMKVQGLTADYIKQMAAAGVKVDTNQLLSMKVQGMTPEYIHEMKSAGVNATNDQMIGMHVEGVTPDYVKEMRAAGVSADSDQWIGLRVEGVTPEYVKSLQSSGLQNLNVDDYIKAREMGITPDFVNKVRSHGFKDLTIDKLIELKSAGVF